MERRIHQYLAGTDESVQAARKLLVLLDCEFIFPGLGWHYFTEGLLIACEQP